MKKKAGFLIKGIATCGMVLTLLFMPLSSFASDTVSGNTTEETVIIDIEDENPPMGVFPDDTSITWWWLIPVFGVGIIGSELIGRLHYKRSTAHLKNGQKNK